MKKALIPLFLLLTLLTLSSCILIPEVADSDPAEPVTGKTDPDTPEDTFSEPRETEESTVTEPADPVETLLAEMTLREKVGQLFIVQPEALDPEGVQAVTDTTRQSLLEYPVGGIIHFGRNISDPEQITTFNAELQASSRIPLFIAVDEEGGLVARLANNPAFHLPTWQNAASIRDTDEALNMGRTIGSYLAAYGFNMDFAPVADVNTNPDNPVIGNRAFSSDAETAGDLASAMAQGLFQQNIIATFKHFPGHGDTAQDSHSELAISWKTHDEMAACEWIPFTRATSRDCIMVGHIAAPEITGDLIPSSLSNKMVTEILRGELGFDGLIVTDSLTMSAITNSYTSAQAALAALNAGCDLLLLPENMTEAFEAVVSAVEDGTLPEETLDVTVKRILSFKLSWGIL